MTGPYADRKAALAGVKRLKVDLEIEGVIVGPAESKTLAQDASRGQEATNR